MLVFLKLGLIKLAEPRYFLLKGERSCTCVLMVSILSLSTIFLLNFGLFPTVWYRILTQFIKERDQ